MKEKKHDYTFTDRSATSSFVNLFDIVYNCTNGATEPQGVSTRRKTMHNNASD